MPPYLLLSLLIAGVYGALFHLWRGKTFRELLLYLGAAVAGFAVGEVAGDIIGLPVFTVGPVHIIEASLASWGLLFIARWLKL
jgi:hypothetical protein